MRYLSRQQTGVKSLAYQLLCCASGRLIFTAGALGSITGAWLNGVIFDNGTRVGCPTLSITRTCVVPAGMDVKKPFPDSAVTFPRPVKQLVLSHTRPVIHCCDLHGGHGFA